MAGLFQVSGLASGLDTADIVKQLMQIERQPIARLQTKKAALNQRADALRALNAQLFGLKGAANQLVLNSTLLARAAATDTPSGNPPVVNVVAGSSAAVGSFKIWVDRLATATRVDSAQAVGNAIDVNLPLKDAGFSVRPISGSFSINGTAIEVDVEVDSLEDVIGRINASVSGVTASLENDASGRPNRLKLSSSSSIQVGSGGDSSNFLTVVRLNNSIEIESSGVYSRTSTGNLGTASTSATLETARLNESLAASGSFRINGVVFSYQAATDTLSGIISRINASPGVGVTASYDSANDRLVLTARNTGATAISLSDETGNFLAATGVLSATQSIGMNALYRIDSLYGGAQMASTSNSISNALPGVNVDLKRESAEPVTVTITQSAGPALEAMRDLVARLNAVIASVREQTGYDANSKRAGMFIGDGLVRGIASRLQNTVLNRVVGLPGSLSSLADIGLSTGAIGSRVGSTSSFVLDEAKFSRALLENPEGVAALLRVNEGESQGVARQLDAYLNGLTAAITGVMAKRVSSLTEQARGIDDRIAAMEARLTVREKVLVAKFQAMESLMAQLQTQSMQMSAQLYQMMIPRY